MKVVHNLDDLERDLREVKRRAPVDMHKCVVAGIKAGNTIAKANAEVSSGAHGVHYPKSFSTEMHSKLNLFGSLIHSGEYGPDIAKPQGGMSFEFGSRNQKPHLDLAKSADVIGGSFAQEVRALPDKWFW